MLIGIILFIGQTFEFSWGLVQLCLGVLFLVGVFRSHRGLILPAIILLTIGGAAMLRDYGVLTYADWRFWPILSGGIGLGLAMQFAVGRSGKWVLVLAAIFLLVSGLGIGSPDLMVFRSLLDSTLRFWPLLIAIPGIALIRAWVKRRRQSDYYH